MVARVPVDEVKLALAPPGKGENVPPSSLLYLALASSSTVTMLIGIDSDVRPAPKSTLGSISRIFWNENVGTLTSLMTSEVAGVCSKSVFPPGVSVGL